MNLRSIRALLFAFVCFFPISVFAQSIDINTASAEQLSQTLQGVGQSKAEAIVAYRNLHGPFKTVDELTHVKGIGKATVQKNLDVIRVEPVDESVEVVTKK